MPTTSKPKLYNPRHPERTLLYQTVAEHYETWLELACTGQFDGQGDHHTPKPYVRKAFEKYLECGIFAHGFARARCDDCGHDFLVAFSCKGRGVCPSCNTRRMAETAAHLSDHVFPRLPVRQWVLSVPKRLRYYMQRDGPVLSMVLRIFLRVIEQTLQANSPGAQNPNKAALHIGAVAFIHRFGSSLNEHVHFHVCVVDGVFEEVAGGQEGDAADAASQISPPRIIFHPATGVTADAVGQAQASLRRRILRAFVGRNLLESFEAQEMLGYKHSGFSVDTSVCIAAHDRSGLERLLRYCARPAFALERLRKAGDTAQPESGGVPATVDAMGVATVGVPSQPEPAQPMQPKRPAHILWAVLIARIYEVFPLLCPICGGQMRIIAFIIYSVDIRQILEHIGVETEPPRITPARGPPLWDECNAQVAEGVEPAPDWYEAAKPAPDFEVDQRIS